MPKDKTFIKIIILFYIISIFIFTPMKSQELQTVDKVDITRYVGKWYEIASFTQRFQKGCHCTTAGNLTIRHCNA